MMFTEADRFSKAEMGTRQKAKPHQIQLHNYTFPVSQLLFAVLSIGSPKSCLHYSFCRSFVVYFQQQQSAKDVKPQ